MTPLRLGFAGTPDFAARHLAAILDSHHELAAVFTQPDRPAGRGKQARPSAVKALALEQGLPVFQPESLRNADAVAALDALQLDVLVVVAYGLLLPQSILDLPRFGCLNVHGSLLPRWRGAAPIQRAIEAGDPETGITIMQMDAGLDTGPMLARARCAITPSTTSGDLYEELARLGPPLLLSVLNDLPAQLAQATPQSNDEATHAAKISKDEACLDWSRPATALARQVHAFNPAPGCYTFIDGQRLKIWTARAVPSRSAEPVGTLSGAHPGEIAVRCQDGDLLLQQIQLPGAKAMSAADVLRGRSELFRPGTQLLSSAAT